MHHVRRPPKKDYYKALNLAKTATMHEIKSSYRKLAPQYHPDKNMHRDSDHKAMCETKFREITEAYEILSNEESRHKYDNYGICDGDVECREPPIQKQHQPHSINIHIHDIFSGINRTLHIPILNKCNQCNGYGSTNGVRNVCSDCNGQKIKVAVREVVPGFAVQQKVPCTTCNQTGVICKPEHHCSSCSGSGKKQDIFTHTLHLPPMFDYLARIRIPNAGHYDCQLDEQCDIIISLTLLNTSTKFAVQKGHHLCLEYDINVYDAWNGSDIYIHHPDGNKYSVNANGIIRDKDIYVVVGLGLPSVSGFGDLYVKFNYTYPTSTLTTLHDMVSFLTTHSHPNLNKEKHIRKDMIPIEHHQEARQQHHTQHSHSQQCQQS